MKTLTGRIQLRRYGFVAIVILFVCIGAFAQQPAAAKIELGSQTAKNGFKNEDEIRDKFNNWKADNDARSWLTAMDYKLVEIESVTARKPHGEKADVEVMVKTRSGIKKEGISIKLVSSPNGFNQIDKRWLATYAKMWKMPADVHASLRLYVGEDPPLKNARDPKRMYLNELDPASQKGVVDFFTAGKDAIVSDIFEGDGDHAAAWMMVAFKATQNTRWVLRRSRDVIKFFGEGKVEITRTGNLRVGRVSMQRKGGDGGRDTAKQLQFKINPVQLFDLK